MDDPSYLAPQKPYRKSISREAQGIGYNYKDLSKLSSLTEEQVASTLNSTTIINNITSSVSDATTTTKGIVELATDGEVASNVVVQGNDSRLVHYGAIQIVFDGDGLALTAGLTCDIYIPYAITLISAVLLADQVGTCAVDVRKDSYSNYPPTGADSIVSATPPSLTAATKSKDTTLSGWTTALSSDTTLQAYLTSTATITRLTLTLYFRKT